MSRYDAVIIGAGHNGLTAANYLARAGKSVCVLEARFIVGGACVTEELIPGAKWSSCSFVQGMLRPEIIEELELRKFGLKSIAPDVQGLGLWEDGDHIILHKDVDATLKSIEAHSRPDGKGFFEFGARLKRFADLSRDWLLSDPPSRAEVFARFEMAGESELLDEFLLMSAGDLLNRYITSERLKGYMMFLGMVSIWGGPSTAQTSYVYGYHACGEFENVFGRWALPLGGMGAISAALRKGAENYGADIRTDAAVKEILVSGGRAAGVRLQDGSTIEAEVVLSNADPARTLGTLLPEENAPGNLHDRAKAHDVRGSMARIHVLIDELPRWNGLPPTGAHHGAHAILNASPAQYEDAADAQRRGEFPDDYVVEALIHSVTDPSMVTIDGQHTLVLGVQQLPYRLKSGDWDDHKDEWTKRIIDIVHRFAPNLRGHILGTHTITPLDLERTYKLTGGNIFQGSMVGLQNLFSARTAPGGENYRTPVPGLYLCGAGVHPGGGVTGAPGHNAAKRVLADWSGEAEKVQRRPGANKTLVDQLLDTEIGKQMGYQVARSRLARDVTRFFSKVRK